MHDLSKFPRLTAASSCSEVDRMDQQHSYHYTCYKVNPSSDQLFSWVLFSAVELYSEKLVNTLEKVVIQSDKSDEFRMIRSEYYQQSATTHEPFERLL